MAVEHLPSQGIVEGKKWELNFEVMLDECQKKNLVIMGNSFHSALYELNVYAHETHFHVVQSSPSMIKLASANSKRLIIAYGVFL